MQRSSLRVVLDTNLVVSAALFPHSQPRQVVDYVVERRAALISTAVFAEMLDVLLRPRFDRYLQRDGRIAVLASLLRASERVTITHRIAACRDPKDDKFLELAISGAATHIVTGDNDLRDLHPFRNIPVIPPAAFLTEQVG